MSREAHDQAILGSYALHWRENFLGLPHDHGTPQPLLRRVSRPACARGDCVHGLIFIEEGSTQARELADVSPQRLGAIITVALRQAKPAPPREVTMGAIAFSKLFNLPAMEAALAQSRARKGN